MIYTTQMLKERYREYANPLDKIHRDVAEGRLFRLVRGVYETNRDTDPMFLASSIFGPSYISFEYALSFYGLIPERVEAITSATLGARKNKTFVNQFGRFEFSDIPEAAFSEGTTYIESGEYAARIATMEKAICDTVYKSGTVASIAELKYLLFVDKRFDVDVFGQCDFALLTRLAKLYSRRSLALLVRLIQKEFLDA